MARSGSTRPTTSKAAARADAPPKLGDVIGQLGPAVAAVDRAEADVAAKAKAQRDVQRAASQRRSTVIGAAEKRLTHAQKACEDAKAAAASAYEAEMAKADEALRVARLRHADACAKAQPLLDALQTTTEKVRTVVARQPA